MSRHDLTRHDLSRRHALAGAALGVTGLASACSDESNGGGSSGGTDADPSPTDAASATSSGSAPAPGSSEPPETDEPVAGLVAAADVPVGGGVVLAEEKLVVTQPTRGTFKAFDATCTHQGCLVGSVDDTIHCPCHGSSFAIADGSVAGGPAPSPLPERQVRVQQGQVVLD